MNEGTVTIRIVFIIIMMMLMMVLMVTVINDDGDDDDDDDEDGDAAADDDAVMLMRITRVSRFGRMPEPVGGLHSLGSDLFNQNESHRH